MSVAASQVPHDLLEAGFLAANPDMAFMNGADRGFMLVELDHSTHHLEFLSLTSIASTQYKARL